MNSHHLDQQQPKKNKSHQKSHLVLDIEIAETEPAKTFIAVHRKTRKLYSSLWITAVIKKMIH